jgi:hypothetical protein
MVFCWGDVASAFRTTGAAAAFSAFGVIMITWTEKDFEQLGWHDNYIHGFTIREGEHGAGELILDIDYILEWKCPTGQVCEFSIAPATLNFTSVTDLQIRVDYASASAATGPMSMEGINRVEKLYPNGYSTYLWTIPLNWPSGEIKFIAPGFVQTLRAKPLWTNEQCLTFTQRTAIL